MDGLEPVPDGVDPGDFAEGEERREREERRRDQEDERFGPSLVELILLFDVEVTQGRILW